METKIGAASLCFGEGARTGAVRSRLNGVCLRFTSDNPSSTPFATSSPQISATIMREHPDLQRASWIG